MNDGKGTGNSATDSNEPGNNLIEERRDYVAAELRRNQLQSDPINQFTDWLAHARDAKLIDATAMALATVDSHGRPHSRIVLLKKFNSKGFTFYTNYDSHKGVQLKTNPHAALLFYWRELERQVRIEGQVVKLPGSDADDYFHSRPEGSRFSAAASRQSAVAENRETLEKAVTSLRNTHPTGEIPRPINWGGYLLKPERLEFWQGREDRLHDRFCYHLQDDGIWTIDRLSP